MAIETNLPSRYEIRVLEPKHIDWASAMVVHSNMCHSPMWTALYPDNKTARVYDGFKHATYLVKHQIESGHSLGVFDKEYRFRRQESAATGGALYWDTSDSVADADELLEQMDFPLVSVALAYDSVNGLDMDKMAGLMGVLPLLGAVLRILAVNDKRDAKSWQANGPGEVLFRNATSTRRDHEGKGIMKALARYMMRTAAAKGFRGIQIECLADAVIHVWSNPPAPFRGEVVSEFHTMTYEEKDEKGGAVHPFRPANQRATKVYCTLKEG
ncbi:Uncharacterized protein TPAR_08879 [Tolypocladium paradoxum]|uniref:N-acetyltransferase domain-containing protein n=1 Tax=Tolypocladium paradoxum TaxID=94208 RepID=A0A2S4KL49_9HYPO|nr:Uncharacterized protein TPAR_08879 [Tolypocladium paradoxum]